MSFVHLHTHSHYSIGRAIPTVRALVRRAADLEMPAIALTDNNSIAGMHELAAAAQEFGIQPILGCELDVLPSGHGVFQGRTHRLVLLVESETGYRNLVDLITAAHRQPPDLPPHVRFTDLERRLGGLIVLTGSPRGELYHWLREGNSAATKSYLNRLARAAGDRNLFFEVMEYPHPRIRKIMDYILELSRFLGIPAVAAQNVHFLDPRDMPAYAALTQFPRFSGPFWPPSDSEMPTRHFTTAAAMQKRFGYTPEILEQTLRIAKRCSFTFPRLRPLIPVPDFERGQDAATLLWDKAIHGAAARYGGLSESLKERLNQEFGDIRGLAGQGIDLTEQFLLLQNLTAFLRKRELCRGVGRGKWITSVIAYALEIVEMDPLAYKLDYQPLREDPRAYPLFEIELSSHGMEESLRYLTEEFGKDSVMTVGRRVDWKRSDLFQHLCRWAGLPPVGLKKFPPEKTMAPLHEPEEAGEGADYAEDGFQRHYDDEIEPSPAGTPGQISWLKNEEIPRQESLRLHKTLAEVTYTLHPCPRGFEAQRGEVVLSKEPISTIVPVIRAPSGHMVTQANADMLDRLQLPRIRFTSFAMMNILEFAQSCIRQEETPRFLLSEIPLNDEATFKILGLGLTNGITPFHGITAKSLLRAERPASISGLLGVHARSRKRRFGEHQPDPVESLPDCVLGYLSAYLKGHYPVAFMVSVLTHSVQSQKTVGLQRPRFQILLRETRKMGIEVLGPDINFSVYAFSQERRGIRTGLMAVQGMGEQTYREIANVRAGRAFTGLGDFCHRTDPRSVNQSQVINLIKAGAFDSLEANRNRLLVDFERELKNARLRSSRYPEPAEYQQLHLFEDSAFEESGSRGSAGPREKTPMPAPRDIMRFEQESLGYSVSHDLLDHYQDLMSAMHVISPFDVHPKLEGKTVFVAGFIDHAEREGPLIDDGTEIVLDLEGKVVKIPPAASKSFTRIQNTQGPVLIEGIVRKHTGAECFLVARGLYLLDEVRGMARDIKTVRLNVGGVDSKTFSKLRAVLKSYHGETAVLLEGKAAGNWWRGRGLDNAKVLFCPPLYRDLVNLLTEQRIRLLDQNGRRVPQSELRGAL